MHCRLNRCAVLGVLLASFAVRGNRHGVSWVAIRKQSLRDDNDSAGAETKDAPAESPPVAEAAEEVAALADVTAASAPAAASSGLGPSDWLSRLLSCMGCGHDPGTVEEAFEERFDPLPAPRPTPATVSYASFMMSPAFLQRLLQVEIPPVVQSLNKVLNEIRVPVKVEPPTITPIGGLLLVWVRFLTFKVICSFSFALELTEGRLRFIVRDKLQFEATTKFTKVVKWVLDRWVGGVAQTIDDGVGDRIVSVLFDDNFEEVVGSRILRMLPQVNSCVDVPRFGECNVEIKKVLPTARTIALGVKVLPAAARDRPPDIPGDFGSEAVQAFVREAERPMQAFVGEATRSERQIFGLYLTDALFVTMLPEAQDKEGTPIREYETVKWLMDHLPARAMRTLASTMKTGVSAFAGPEDGQPAWNALQTLGRVLSLFGKEMPLLEIFGQVPLGFARHQNVGSTFYLDFSDQEEDMLEKFFVLSNPLTNLAISTRIVEENIRDKFEIVRDNLFKRKAPPVPSRVKPGRCDWQAALP